MLLIPAVALILALVEVLIITFRQTITELHEDGREMYREYTRAWRLLYRDIRSGPYPKSK